MTARGVSHRKIFLIRCPKCGNIINDQTDALHLLGLLIKLRGGGYIECPHCHAKITDLKVKRIVVGSNGIEPTAVLPELASFLS